MILRYYHTLKYLKPSQILWRLWYHFYKFTPKLPTGLSARDIKKKWIEAITKPNPFSNAGITFLNHTEKQPLEALWQSQDIEILWLYNLHYFDYVNSELISNWITHNPPITGRGWEPYPISRRLVNWIKYSTLEINSVALQAEYLSKHIEYHLLANHLLANAKALVFAGLFLKGPAADRWLMKGVQIFQTQIPEQILEDGAHFELSPMYHAIVLEDFLDLVNLFQVYQDARVEKLKTLIESRIPIMFAWLKTMIHPDNDISFFNDATLGIAPTYTQLLEYAHRLGQPIKSHAIKSSSGYYRLEKGMAVVIADAGKIGPDYQPGHAHADTLSFEMSLGVQRIFVNSGISCYGISDERLRQRGSAAHNTAVIDGENSSDVWSGFRVGRRVKLGKVDYQETEQQVFLNADIIYPLNHERQWQLRSDQLIIIDTIENKHEHSFELFFHVHPDITPVAEKESINLIDNVGNRLASFSANHPVEILESTYHPGFGITQSNYLLIMMINAKVSPSIKTQIRWSRIQ